MDPSAVGLRPSRDPSLAFTAFSDPSLQPVRTGSEPLLGGALRQKAVWVDEAVCIGCRYCAHVAANTFLVESRWGRSRAIRQDGDSTDRIQEAIDTCPVDCIHWVAYEDLPVLEARLQEQELHPLGLPSPARLKRTLPRSGARS
ncbi:MAG: ferredoxin [Cyanobacteriota bacterium]